MRTFTLIIFIISVSHFSLAQNPYEVHPKTEINKNSEKSLTEEEKFVIQNFPFIHMADWKTGMRFIIEPDVGSRTKLNLSRYKKSGSDAPGPLQSEYQGKIFSIVTLEERQISCPRGKCTRTYIIMECEGTKFEYEVLGSIDELREKEGFTTIDNMIYVDEIDKAREVLIGKNLYLLHDLLSLHQTKFIPVTITNVGMGSALLSRPVKIIYTNESGKEYSIEIKLSGINVKGKGGKQFQEIFSFENPKDNYPNIADAIWSLIQNGKVVTGMTEKECELSWGKPQEINTTITGSDRRQQWVYFFNKLFVF